MKPISRKWLPQTITLFNLFKDPETGEPAYFRTFLDGVSEECCKTSLAMSLQGAKKAYQSMVYIDPVSTLGYTRDGSGRKIAKKYLSARKWQELGTDENADFWTLATAGFWTLEPASFWTPEKAGFWTLNEKDWLLFRAGEKVTEGPDIVGSGLKEQAFREKYGVRVISEIPPAIDKDGSVHHWEIRLD
jgi:hypothetical protein